MTCLKHNQTILKSVMKKEKYCGKNWRNIQNIVENIRVTEYN